VTVRQRLDRASATARRAARLARDATVGVAPPASRAVVYPPDVADAEALRRMLADTDIFSDPEEARTYLGEALHRFRITMALLPSLPQGARILELGSNPYFLTRLLRRRGLDVTGANYFGDAYTEPRARHVVHSGGTEEVFDFDHFNVEKDDFPYPDDSFDLVLCCEILEHIPCDPVHMLTEIHRVVRKPSGHLLLTTPNPNRLENLLRMHRGDNVYEQLSGYGVYGRHNREYTAGELRTLLEGCGFTDLDVFDMDIHDHRGEWTSFPPGASRAERGCNLFALGRAGSQRRWQYPEWLFASAHALRRVVEPGVVMGVNCDLQTGGFHPLERMGGSRYARWMGPRSEAVLDVPKGGGALCIEGVPAPAAAGQLRLEAEVAGRTFAWDLPAGRDFVLVTPPNTLPGGRQTVVLRSTTWSPAEVGLSADTRVLGACLCRIAPVSAADTPAGGLLPAEPEGASAR
jgi:SAM-dependent methyltransferase